MTAADKTPNPDEVICTNCVHQFRAIPENVQAELAAKTREVERFKCIGVIDSNGDIYP